MIDDYRIVDMKGTHSNGDSTESHGGSLKVSGKHIFALNSHL